MKNTLLLIALITVYTAGAAQKIDSTLSRYADDFVPEKIHLHFDRTLYGAGETVFYKAYIMQGDAPSPLSKTLYLDWYDASGLLLRHTTAPIVASGAAGSFDIPKAYQGAAIHAIGYTAWMLNFDSAFLYQRRLTIYQPAQKTEASFPSSAMQVQVYPEGGFAIAGLTNRFAFRAYTPSGAPVAVKGVLKTSDGKELDSIATMHNGMGVFSLYTAPNETYLLEWTDTAGITGITKIAAQKKSGARLQVLPGYKKAYFSVERTTTVEKPFTAMHLLVHKNETLLYKYDIDMAVKTRAAAVVPTGDLPTGILQFTLFTNDWLPVAERLIFVNNHNQCFYPEVKIVKKDLNKKAENSLELIVTDTSLSNLSIAVTDASFADAASPTIFSDFWLHEIESNVFDAASYFLEESNNVRDSIKETQLAAQLDLVLLTHGHRRFDWEKLAKGKLPQINYPAETEYLPVRGSIKNFKPRRNDSAWLSVMLTHTDSSKTFLNIPVKPDGSFEQTPVFYYDSVQAVYSLRRAKSTSKPGTVNFSKSLLTEIPRTALVVPSSYSSQPTASLNHQNGNNTATIPFFNVQSNGAAASTTLKEVVVQARTKTALQKLDEFYTRGFFSGDVNNYKVDVANDGGANGAVNLFYFLQSKIPGLQVTGTPPNVNVLWFTNATIQSGDSGPAIFLDEVPVSLESVSTLSITDIAYVKAFRPPFVGAFLNGLHGAIAIYTKKGFAPVTQTAYGSGLQSALLHGYTRFKEFTTPDYSDAKTALAADNRPTVYFNPFVLTDKTNQHITFSFFNNDVSRKLCIIVEGMNAAGKLARVVKTLE